ncbi:MAG: aminotransferase class V-fold PLP-dependent enzyme [Candidatus Latescibacteria bacterium]|jgi:cysteine desulfurase / selenocysteine lyase|nr:aminotransferase class V-fold PLP-dependent enzyme [Candidatus Latescibacterota bacterium]
MLIPTSDFIGLEGLTHLCAGGETPMLKSHANAVNRFMGDKVWGEESRERFESTSQQCKSKIGQLLHVDAEEIALLAHSSEGVNLLAHALPWKSGDNIIVADVEFPSDVLPWKRLEKIGVEVRIVKNRNWSINLEDIDAAMDENTRLVAISHVSYFTGQRLSLSELADLVHSKGALLHVDATHAAGVVPVEAYHADTLVSSCYKWLLGVHGAGIFYWNRASLPDLEPPFLGWHTPLSIPEWNEPGAYTPRPDAGRFEPGNEGFISVYILDNALGRLLEIGIPSIEKYVLGLSSQVWEGLNDLGWEMMTPRESEHSAGNVCFMAENIKQVTDALEEKGIYIWGSYGGVGRARVSTHLYNSEDDVAKFLNAMKEIPVTHAQPA